MDRDFRPKIHIHRTSNLAYSYLSKLDRSKQTEHTMFSKQICHFPFIAKLLPSNKLHFNLSLYSLGMLFSYCFAWKLLWFGSVFSIKVVHVHMYILYIVINSFQYTCFHAQIQCKRTKCVEIMTTFQECLHTRQTTQAEKHTHTQLKSMNFLVNTHT